MNLRGLSDKNLLENLNDLVHGEREITLKVLHHLREVERRHLYAKLSYSSLFEYAVKELKYSESAAQRRISSMRLLREIPEIEAKVESGALTLSALSKAQSFFRQEKEKITSVQAKVQILQTLENKSLQQVQKELVSRSSNPFSLVPERVRAVSDTHSEIKFLAEAGLLSEIEELRNLLSHAKPNATIKDLIAFSVSRTVKELRPKAPKVKLSVSANDSGGDRKVVSGHDPRTNRNIGDGDHSQPKAKRYIEREIKRQVWQRDRGQCTFIYPARDRQCCSKHKLEFDHILPFAMGGDNSAENLRLRCRAHNQLAAIESFGAKKLAQFIPRIRSSTAANGSGVVDRDKAKLSSR